MLSRVIEFDPDIDGGQDQIPADESARQLGQGYNIFTGKYLPNSAVSTDRDPIALSGEGYNHEFINAVQNMAENTTATDTSAGFNLVYKLFSLGASTGSSSTHYFNSIDQFARVYKRIMTSGKALAGEAMTEEAEAAAVNRADFVRQYGTHYVRGLYYGHVLDQELRFKMTSDITASGNRTDLSAGIKGILGFSYGNAGSQKKVDDNSTTTAIDNSKGLINVIPLPANAGGVQTLVQYARETFPQKVIDAAPDKAALLIVELSPYYALKGDAAASIPQWPDDITDSVVGREQIYELFLSAFSDLLYAAALDDTILTAVYKDTRPEISAKLALAATKQDTVRQAAKDCNDLLGQWNSSPADIQRCKDNLLKALTANDVTAVTPHLK